MYIPKNAKIALDLLQKEGYKAGVVGGCVRDFIMGNIPHDYDITTSAKPEEIKKVFSSFNILTLGEKHGTITPVINGEPIEITTFRIDGDYSDGRRPDSVIFTNDINEDLLRRDFTINSIYYNGLEFIDPYNGINDIEDKIIRAVGVADERFKEDSLRILRAMRFASKYGFKIEESTKEAMISNKHLLKNVSVERISSEFIKILNGYNYINVINEFKEIISEFIPEFKSTFGFNQNNPWHAKDVWEHTIDTLKSLEDQNNIKHKLVLLFHDIGKPDSYVEVNGEGHFYGHPEISEAITRDVFKRLKLTSADGVDSKMFEDIYALIKTHDIPVSLKTPAIVKIIIRDFKGDKELFKDLIAIKIADSKGQNIQLSGTVLSFYDDLQLKFDYMLDANLLVTKLSELKINGDDLISLGYPKGVVIGKTLNNMLNDVSVGNIENTREALMKSAKRRLEKIS